jgi:hypothetical protein
MAPSTKKISKRVTSSKYQGDDHFSHAVFIDGRPYVTGLGKREVSHYKKQAIDLLIKREGL